MDALYVFFYKDDEENWVLDRISKICGSEKNQWLWWKFGQPLTTSHENFVNVGFTSFEWERFEQRSLRPVFGKVSQIQVRKPGAKSYRVCSSFCFLMEQLQSLKKFIIFILTEFLYPPLPEIKIRLT